MLRVVFIISEMLPNLYKITNLIRPCEFNETACDSALAKALNGLHDKLRDVRYFKLKEAQA